jgi:hypothetical protein
MAAVEAFGEEAIGYLRTGNNYQVYFQEPGGVREGDIVCAHGLELWVYAMTRTTACIRNLTPVSLLAQAVDGEPGSCSDDKEGVRST